MEGSGSCWAIDRASRHVAADEALAAVAAAFVAAAARRRALRRRRCRRRGSSKFYPELQHTADALLRNAASHARDGQWAEAIEIYQRVIQQYGDKVVELAPAVDPRPRRARGRVAPEDSILYVDVRHFCQRRLAALPPEAPGALPGPGRRAGRALVPPGAEAERDRASLRRVVEQAFC